MLEGNPLRWMEARLISWVCPDLQSSLTLIKPLAVLLELRPRFELDANLDKPPACPRLAPDPARRKCEESSSYRI